MDLYFTHDNFKDVLVGFQQTEYTVTEALGDMQICVEHKECLQRDVAVEIALDTIVTGTLIAEVLRRVDI